MVGMKVRVDDQNLCYYPDVSVVCDPSDDDTYVKRSPCILVEVLSESTETIDRREKLAAYLSLPGLRYYLLVSSLRRRVEYFARNREGEWEIAALEDGERLDLRCGDYCAALDLARIYEDLVFS